MCIAAFSSPSCYTGCKVTEPVAPTAEARAYQPGHAPSSIVTSEAEKVLLVHVVSFGNGASSISKIEESYRQCAFPGRVGHTRDGVF